MCGAVFRSSRLTRVSRGSAGSCTNNVATARRCRGRHAPPMSVNLSRGPLLRPGRSCPQRRHRWYRWLPSFHATTNLCIPSLHCQGLSFMLSSPTNARRRRGYSRVTTASGQRVVGPQLHRGRAEAVGPARNYRVTTPARLNDRTWRCADVRTEVPNCSEYPHAQQGSPTVRVGFRCGCPTCRARREGAQC